MALPDFAGMNVHISPRDKNLSSPDLQGTNGDKTLENICKCTENAVNKRKEEKIP